MNWYEERKFKEEVAQRAKEAAANNPEFAKLVVECSKMVDKQLKSIDEKLADK